MTEFSADDLLAFITAVNAVETQLGFSQVTAPWYRTARAAAQAALDANFPEEAARNRTAIEYLLRDARRTA